MKAKDGGKKGDLIVNKRKESLKGLRTANSYSGATTFFRREFGTDFENADVVIQGLPFDLGTSNRPGARFGPRGIRSASAQLSWGEIWPWGIDPFEHVAVLDAGDVEFTYGISSDFYTQAATQTEKIIAAGAIPFSLGGDHSITAATLDGVSRIVGPVALLHFDAHCDLTDGHEHQHGSMFRFAAKRGIVKVEHSIQIGLRTPYDASLGYAHVGAAEAVQTPPETLAKRIMDRIGETPCYVTVDIDCLDPAYAPGTGTPIPGGLTTMQLLEILRGLKHSNLNIVALDLVEVAPDYDHAQITALAAAQISVELLCLISHIRLQSS